jgi:hypothetical protein
MILAMQQGWNLQKIEPPLAFFFVREQTLILVKKQREQLIDFFSRKFRNHISVKNSRKKSIKKN